MAFALSGCLKGCEEKKETPPKPEKSNLEKPAEKPPAIKDLEEPKEEAPAEKSSEMDKPEEPKEESLKLPEEPEKAPPVEEKKGAGF